MAQHHDHQNRQHGKPLKIDARRARGAVERKTQQRKACGKCRRIRQDELEEVDVKKSAVAPAAGSPQEKDAQYAVEEHALLVLDLHGAKVATQPVNQQRAIEQPE